MAVSEMVERVARAQWELSRSHGVRLPWEEVTGEYRQAALDLARVAIEAMGVNTIQEVLWEAMDNAGMSYDPGALGAVNFIREELAARLSHDFKPHRPKEMLDGVKEAT